MLGIEPLVQLVPGVRSPFLVTRTQRIPALLEQVQMIDQQGAHPLGVRLDHRLHLRSLRLVQFEHPRCCDLRTLLQSREPPAHVPLHERSNCFSRDGRSFEHIARIGRFRASARRDRQNNANGYRGFASHEDSLARDDAQPPVVAVCDTRGVAG